MSASLDEQLIEEDKGILVFPNPMESNCTIRLSRSKPGDQVSISIYDYTGKLISVVEKNALVTTESFESQWNGKNEAGEEVKPGIYFISVNTNGFLSTSQLVKR